MVQHLRFVLCSLFFHFASSYFMHPSLQICDRTKARTFKKNFCPTKLVFTGNYTKLNSDCLCITGVWLILNRDCVPSVIAAKNGCILTPQIKAIQYLGSLGKGDFFGVVSKQKSGSEYELMRPVRGEKAQGYVWLFNGMLNKSDDGTFCAQKRSKLEQKAKGWRYIARYEIKGRVTLQYGCVEDYKYPVEPQMEYGIIASENSECKMDCYEIPRSRLLVKPKIIETEMGTFFSVPSKTPIPPNHNKKSKKEMNTKKTMSGSLSSRKENLTKTHYNRPKPHESLTNHLNTRLLRKLVTFAFPTTDDLSKLDTFPRTTFKIFERILKIVERVCGGKVRRRFLRYASELFKAAYENRGTHLLEYLREDEGTEILKFLNECYGLVKPIDWEEVSAIQCKDDVNRFRKGGTYVKLNGTEVHGKEFFLTRRHLAIETPWNIVDITVGACIDAFAQSYILYHKMEQALERLFVKDLKTLWKIPPKEKIYRRLYGPFWFHHAEQLEQCVEAVYSEKGKLARLRRPDEVLSGRSSRTFSDDFNKPKSTSRIPGILAPRRQTTVMKKGKLIIESAHLSCQNFDMLQCYELQEAQKNFS